MKNKALLFYIASTFFLVSLKVHSQEIDSFDKLDQDFLDSLPQSVQDDILSEVSKKETSKQSIQKRPTVKLEKYNTVRKWQEFQKSNFINNESERYGLKLFQTMQSSFMPLNEPNFSNDYILDYGDFLNIQTFGSIKSDIQEIEVKRDGSIVIDGVGQINLAGLSIKQAAEIIKNKFTSLYIGAEVAVTLSSMKDINVLITGNVQFPGIYTLSGNSNILQILNVAGGIDENGSLRKIVLKRKNADDIVVDLYEALIFGNIKNIPFLKSGDSIHITSAKKLARVGYGFNKRAIFELKDNETLQDLINFAGGLSPESENGQLRLVRFHNGNFETLDVISSQYGEFKILNLDSVYAYKENIGTIEISGSVKYPGKYTISSSDRMLDVITRAGGYTDQAYKFGGRLFRDSVAKLEEEYAAKHYQNIINFMLSSPKTNSSGGSGDQISYLLSELKSFNPTGRVITEFNEEKLKTNIDDNIFINDGDRIFIPKYSSNVYVFGEVGHPGSVLFNENYKVADYIKYSGGLTKFSSKDAIFIVDPSGSTSKININGVLSFIDQDIDIYPGSVIYVARDIGKIQGVDFYSTIAPIFSSMALSIASLNSLNN